MVKTYKVLAITKSLDVSLFDYVMDEAVDAKITIHNNNIPGLLGLMDEVDHLQVFVQTPGPEVRGVYVSCSYPDFHDVSFRRCIEVRP